MHLRRRCILLLSLVLCLGRAGQSQSPYHQHHVGRVLDWTSHHIVVSGGLTTANLEAAQHDPRILFRLAERNLVRPGSGAVPFRVVPLDPESYAPDFSPARRRPIDGTDPGTLNRRNQKVDWSLNLAAGNIAPFMFPAKFSFDINALPDCVNDYVVFGLNVAGVTGGQANVVVLNRLYSGGAPRFCNNANPNIRWSYNGSTAAGSILTSPVISLDGTKIAYIESTAASAIFHILTLMPGGQGNNVTNAQAPTLPPACTAATSCLKSVTFSATATTTLASPWVDYQTDKGFVAGNDGKIYRISCVFACGLNAQPVVDWTFTLPVAGSGGAQPVPNGPVYDFPSGVLFVGDQLGELWALNAGGGVPTLIAGPVMIGGGGCTAAHPPGRTGTGADCAASGGSFGIPDSVIFDPSGPSRKVFAFSGNDGTAGASAVVAQLNGTLNGLIRVHVGLGSVANNATNVDLHTGTFDDAYFGANPTTGHLFMCGTAAGNTQPTHYWIGFSGYPNMDAAPAGSLLRTAVAGLPCAPYTEIFNPNLNLGGVPGHHDLLISGLMGAGGNGYIITNDISLGTIAAALNFTNYPGGVSGIIIDNVSSQAQASSVYFTTQGVVNVGGCANQRCAVKLTQLNLQ